MDFFDTYDIDLAEMEQAQQTVFDPAAQMPPPEAGTAPSVEDLAAAIAGAGGFADNPFNDCVDNFVPELSEGTKKDLLSMDGWDGDEVIVEGQIQTSGVEASWMTEQQIRDWARNNMAGHFPEIFGSGFPDIQLVEGQLIPFNLEAFMEETCDSPPLGFYS